MLCYKTVNNYKIVFNEIEFFGFDICDDVFMVDIATKQRVLKIEVEKNIFLELIKEYTEFLNGNC